MNVRLALNQDLELATLPPKISLIHLGI